MSGADKRSIVIFRRVPRNDLPMMMMMLIIIIIIIVYGPYIIHPSVPAGPDFPTYVREKLLFRRRNPKLIKKKK